jgi:diguanylate cyclase (GGDEF)-like protein
MNRLAYERRLKEEWNRAARTRFSIGVIIIDLDHFKSINDHYGHAAGDRVLRDVAAILEKGLRSYDILARYGGDEFIALCLGCRPRQIEIPIRRMLTNLRAVKFRVAAESLPISVSIGAAVCHDGFSEANPSDMFAVADRCLYRAKETRGTAAWIDFGAGWQNERSVSSVAPLLTEGFVGTSSREELAF